MALTKKELLAQVEELRKTGVVVPEGIEDLTNAEIASFVESQTPSNVTAVPEKEKEAEKAEKIEPLQAAPENAALTARRPEIHEYLYKGKIPVKAVNNRLVNGKMYKEVVLASETYLFTVDEFNAHVSIKSNG